MEEPQFLPSARPRSREFLQDHLGQENDGRSARVRKAKSQANEAWPGTLRSACWFSVLDLEPAGHG